MCLKGEHISKICKSSYLCRKCGGKHHISICKFEEKNDNPQVVVSHVESCRLILLQTARASVLDNKNSCNTIILFDTRSQRSFITENVRKRLRLKTVRTEKISISVFGDSKESRLENLDLVEFKINHRFENSYSVVEALVYPVICSDIKGQLVSVVKVQYDHISRLTLAHFDNQNERFPVGVLDPSVAANLSCITGHILRCSTGSSSDELREDLSIFWNVEDLTNSEKTCV